MRYRLLFIPLFLFSWLTAAAQQEGQPLRSSGAESTAPLLLPYTPKIAAPKRCDELDGVVRFAGIVDAVGLPRELKTLEASDRRLVGFATEIVEAQRFKPGVVDGSAAAVAVELTVGLHTCAGREKHPADGDFYRFTLRAHPLIAVEAVARRGAQGLDSAAPAETAGNEDVGGRISAPIPIVLSDPAIPPSRKLAKRGVCVLAVKIDAGGVPKDIRVARSLDPELDNAATEAVRSWRFKPALRDGLAPVAVEGTVAAAFEYVEKEPVAFAIFFPDTPEKIEALMAQAKGKWPNLEPINADEVVARYMPQSRVSGRCLVSLVIDAKGVPQNVHIVKGLDSSLDQETVAMVERLRFKPAMKDATTPVPVGVIVPVRYRKMLERPTWKDVFTEGLALAIFSII